MNHSKNSQTTKEELLNTLNKNLRACIEKQASWGGKDLTKMVTITPAVLVKADEQPGHPGHPGHLGYKVSSIKLCKELSKLLTKAYEAGYLDDDSVHKMKLALDKEELIEIYERCGDEPEAFITSYVYLELEPQVIKNISQVC